jgi:hypothetical protein
MESLKIWSKTALKNALKHISKANNSGGFNKKSLD